MTEINAELARVYQNVANGLLFQGEAWFKVKAYLDFVELLTALERPVDELSDHELNALPGVGKAISTKTRKYLETGSFDLYERLQTDIDGGAWEMLEAGIPPAAVRHLRDKTGVTTTIELRRLFAAGELDLTGVPKKQRTEIREFLDSTKP